MDNKIKVMHIAQAAGGVSRYLETMLKYFDRERFENILVCSNDYSLSDFEGLVDAVEFVDMQREIGFSDLKTAFKIRRLIKKYRPDVVYAHSSKAGASARLGNLFIKNKLIYNPHGWAFNMKVSPKKQKLLARLERIMAHFSDKIVCISEAERKDALKRKICKSEKLRVILNGIDIAGYKGVEAVKRSALKIPEDAYVVGMVGRISEQKAPDVFIEAAGIIKKEIPNAFFIIVGDGDMRAEIEGLAEENGLGGSLMITGWTDNVKDYVYSFDTAVLLSRWEGFGLVLPEYMISKKPVVACAVDAIPEIVHDGETGLLVAPDDPGAAAEAVLRIYRDKALKERLIENGYKCAAEKYDVKRVAEQTSELIQELLSE